MRQILFLLTRPPDPLAAELVEAERHLPQHQVETVDLNGTVEYDQLLEKIFRADSIQVF